MSRIPFASALATLCLVGMPAASQAAGVEDFYKGKTVSINVGFAVGNAYDAYGRLIGRYLGKHIPGNPTVVVQNMVGAGSLNVANFIYNVAPKDGTAIGVFNRNVPMEPLLGNKNAQFDGRKFTWIGSAGKEASVCVSWHSSPVKTIDDLLKTELVVGGTGLSADSGLIPVVLADVIGAKTKLITGYPGGNEISLALERGEVQGRCGWSWGAILSSKPDWIADKKLNILLQANLVRSSALPDVPLALDYAKTDEQRQLLKLVFSWQEMAWPFFAPPALPADRSAALRAAFAKTMADPDMLAQAKKENIEVSLVPGADVEKIVEDIYKTPPSVVDNLKKIIASR